MPRSVTAVSAVSAVSALALPALALGACTPVRMAVPQEVSTVSDEIAISDRSAMSGALVDESFKMGPYQVTDVNRKWNSASSGSIGNYSSGDSKGGYAFGFKSATEASKGQCASQLDEKAASAFGITMGQQSYTVLCECAGPAAAGLMLKADTTSHYHGTLTARNASYTIEGVYTDEKGSSSGKPLGYRVFGPAAVGAVEVSGKGRVWLAKSLDTRARADLACLFAGLLLYQPPQRAIDK
jgi:hypothetical protein